MDPEVRLLRYFLTVAEELNFTRAAERLHIAQPSLSAQIRQLESRLGVRLLHRSTRSVALTDAGRVLLERGPRALAGIEQAWQAARDAGRGVTGSLRLAYTLSAGHDTVPCLVEAAQQALPGVAVSTDVLPTPAVLDAVRAGRAEAGIARAPAPTDQLVVRPLRREPEGLLVAAGHPLAALVCIDLERVADYPVVLHPRAANPAHHDFVREIFAARELAPTFVERDIALDLSQRIVTDGDAVALVGRSVATRLPPDLRWLPLTEHIAVTTALVLPAAERPAVTERFARMAFALASEHGWLG